MEDRRNYTEEEKKAIREKIDFPEKKVICPRCGKKLLYKEIGNSIEIKCKTDKCLYGGIRGI